MKQVVNYLLWFWNSFKPQLLLLRSGGGPAGSDLGVLSPRRARQNLIHHMLEWIRWSIKNPYLDSHCKISLRQISFVVSAYKPPHSICRVKEHGLLVQDEAVKLLLKRGHQEKEWNEVLSDFITNHGILCRCAWSWLQKKSLSWPS